MDKKNTYIFPAIFEKEGKYINVYFPDLAGCLTYGEGLANTLDMARECLEGYLCSLEENKINIPNPSDIENITLEKGQYVQFIEAYMIPIRQEMANRRVNKNVTIPKWLEQLGREKGVNFSSLLESALMDKLKVKR